MPAKVDKICGDKETTQQAFAMQQAQPTSSSSLSSTFFPSVQSLENAFELLLQNNFDVDSKGCVLTWMKILDNVLHQPNNDKVRSIRMQNPAFWQKVGSRKGGLQFLQACGFVPDDNNEFLVLPPKNENQSHLVTARSFLQTKAVQELQMNQNEIPTFRQPPPPPTLPSAAVASESSSFDVYKGHRFDAQSAAVGTSLGPSASYISPTEQQLQHLQKQKKDLEEKLKQENAHLQRNRMWMAVRPGENMPVTSDHVSADNTTATTGSDASLLAARAKKQMEDRMQRENGPLTTKAMRDLQKLKKQKVYTHAILTIQFPDGTKLQGRFLPAEKLLAVHESLRVDCLKPEVEYLAFDLYITPPKQILSPNVTLQDMDLVPAAKVFFAWKPTTQAATTHILASSAESYLRPNIFVRPNTSFTASTAFPTAVPVISNNFLESSKPSTDASGAASKPVPTATSKEDELLRRMMGGGSGKLGKSSNFEKSTDSDKKQNSKPKWFKG